MEKLVTELKEILEISDLPLHHRFDDLSEWDSLNALTVIALLDSNYGIRIDAESLQKFKHISEFIDYVLANQK